MPIMHIYRFIVSGVLTCTLYLLAANGAAAPGSVAAKPIDQDPPPIYCPLVPGIRPCDLI